MSFYWGYEKIENALKLLNEEQSPETYHINLSAHPACRISDEIAVKLADGLRKNTIILHLDISNTALSDDAMECFSSALQQNTTLTRLEIYGNASCSRGYNSLFSRLGGQNTTLRTIFIDITNDNIDNFVTMMNRNTSLRELLLRNRGESFVTKENFVKLCRSIEVHNYLRYFYIDEFFDFYDTDGIDAISAIIGNNKQLTSISFEGFGLKKITIKEALQKNQTLLSIYFVGFGWRFRDEIQTRNKAINWKSVHAVILDICIAMAALEIPNYVLLEIVDWLPNYYFAVSHLKKIRLIESVNRSIRQIYGNQQQ